MVRAGETWPTCPWCGQPAWFVLGATQAFCGNEACAVLMWNPLDPDSWTAPHVIDLDDDQADGLG